MKQLVNCDFKPAARYRYMDFITSYAAIELTGVTLFCVIVSVIAVINTSNHIRKKHTVQCVRLVTSSCRRTQITGTKEQN